MSIVDDDDDELVLPSDTLAALQEFMSEKDAREKRFAELKTQAEARHAAVSTEAVSASAAGRDDINDVSSRPGGGLEIDTTDDITMKDFEPDWNASQFWYDDETSTILAKALVEGATEQTVVGLVSAPTVFVKLRELMKEGQVPKCEVHVFEFDRRFEIFKEFTFYDFNSPMKLPLHLKGRFDRILVDPPFLSEDCQTKAALTVRWLSKPWQTAAASKQSQKERTNVDKHNENNNNKNNDNIDKTSDSPAPTTDSGGIRIMVCTGERMKNLVEDKLYKAAGVRCTSLEVRHSQGLSNEFQCYSSFENDIIKHI